MSSTGWRGQFGKIWKMTKLGFLSKNSCEGTWGAQVNFWVGESHPVPLSLHRGNPELIQIIWQSSEPCTLFRHKVFIRIYKKY